MSYEKPTFIINPSHPHPHHAIPTQAMYSPMLQHPHHPSPIILAYQPQPQQIIYQPTPAPIRRTGFCKFFNPGKGFGFIQDDHPSQLPTLEGDPGTDIFVHYSCIMACEAPFKSLADGEKVEYYLGRSNKGLAALEITGPNRAPVKGCSNHHSQTPRSHTTGTAVQHQQQQQLAGVSVRSPIINFPPPSPTLNHLLNKSTTPNISPSPDLNLSTFYQHFSRSTSPQTNVSPTFGINLGAVGTKSMRREATESSFLSVMANNNSIKMSRNVSSPTPSAGLGIGVIWEPSSGSRKSSGGGTPIWSPPGGRRVSLNSQSSHFPSVESRKLASDHVDRTKSNWRQDSASSSPKIVGNSSPTISV